MAKLFVTIKKEQALRTVKRGLFLQTLYSALYLLAPFLATESTEVISDNRIFAGVIFIFSVVLLLTLKRYLELVDKKVQVEKILIDE